MILNGLARPLGVLILVLLGLVLGFGLVRAALIQWVEFPWYDFDWVFIVIMPLLLAWLVRAALSRRLLIRYPFNPEQFDDLKFAVLLFMGVGQVFSQFILGDLLMNHQQAVEHPADVRKHLGSRTFLIDQRQFKIKKYDFGWYFEKKVNLHRARGGGMSGTTFRGFLVYEVLGTSRTVWWGRSFSQRHRGTYRDPNDELFLAFQDEVLDQAHRMTDPNTRHFKTASYAVNKSELVKAVKTQHPELGIQDVTILLNSGPEVFTTAHKLLLTLVIWGLMVVVFAGYVVTKRVYLLDSD
ncbi:hypothetical protein [Marinicella meishanensis]|uniref:hypothetical protein n=1 Tax=Marinicella meishanensis TaxID=2873263 RepID=UPI001CBB35AB|nr:hypothetical protein [Marinicella sp. NBU2979]